MDAFLSDTANRESAEACLGFACRAWVEVRPLKLQFGGVDSPQWTLT